MNPDEFRKLVESINVATRNGHRAPHKPLLILLALRRLLNGEPPFAKYVEIKQELLPLLKRFNGHVLYQHPEQPFTFLRKDGLWKILPEDLPANNWEIIDNAVLVQAEAEGGFPEEVYDLLKSDHSLVDQAIAILLARHFAPSLHGDVLEAVGLTTPDETRLVQARARDPQFRSEVLGAYEWICAICKYDVEVDGELFGLEAAHIRWHSHGGPDEISNGLALCSFHHKALDRGAIGLEPVGGRFHLLLSSRLHGQSETLKQLKQFHCQPINCPSNPVFNPNPEHVKWHTRQVFRRPPMELRSW